MRLYELTRDKHFLRRGCAIILISCILISWCIRLVKHDSSRDSYPDITEFLEPEESENTITTLQLRQHYHELLQISEPSPILLSEWLRSASQLREAENDNNAVILRNSNNDESNSSEIPHSIVSIFQCSIPEILQTHTRNPQEKLLFTHYLNCLFHPDPDLHSYAYEKLQQACNITPTPRFACEFVGDLQLILQQKREALQSYLAESLQPDSTYARKQALRLAFQLEDNAALSQLVANPNFINENKGPHQLRQIAHLTNDKTLLAQAHWRLILDHWSHPLQVTVALVSIIIWSIILFCSGNRNNRILFLCGLAILFGIFSGWLTRWFLDAFQYNSNREFLPSNNPAHLILQSIFYIGIPEEAAKLLLILPFIPWILVQKYNDSDSAGTTALIGGFTGLGFALEENLQYFMEGNESIALGRMLTANVLHLSLTGYIAWHLHHLIQSRFHSATSFLLAFLFISVAHGIYDFLIIDANDWGTQVFAIMLLAVVTRQYLRSLLTMNLNLRRFVISRTCVFVFGSTLLTGLIMIIYSWRAIRIDQDTMVPLLQNAISLIPIALIYVYEFDEVR